MLTNSTAKPMAPFFAAGMHIALFDELILFSRVDARLLSVVVFMF